MQRRRAPRPPVRSCRGCGTDLYSWAEAPLCPKCVADTRIGWETTESWRAWRKRVLEGK
jgi:hypothetical protein